MLQRRRGRQVHAIPLGGLVVVLAVVGIIAIAVFLIRVTYRVMDNSAEKKELEELLKPMVMFDAVPFQKAADIEPLSLLQYSMWDVLNTDKKLNYAYDEVGLLIVPASDLNVAATELFGSDVQLAHQSFGDYETTYYYDEGGFYLVPSIINLVVYEPKVEEIRRSGDTYTVRVGYIPPGSVWRADTTGNMSGGIPEKYMIYELKKVKNSYQIVALRDPPTETPVPTRQEIVPQDEPVSDPEIQSSSE